MRTDKKRFIVRKYVMAKSAKEAIKREKEVAVADVWIDDAWLNQDANRDIKGF